MSMIYEWRSDSRFPVGAQIAAERLKKIKNQYGAITPRVVVDDAANPRSPLHPCFEWDDETAADNFRLAQARKLIGSIVVAEMDDQIVNLETRAFVHITVGDGARYEAVEVAMADDFMREEVLERAKREIKFWRARYAGYEEFADLVAGIDAL
jgi:hypothetical protein